MAHDHLRYLLAHKRLDPCRCSSLVVVTMTELSELVFTPSVNITRLRQDERKASFGYFEILDLQILGRLHSMWPEELAKDTASPDIYLSISCQSTREAACPYLDNP